MNTATTMQGDLARLAGLFEQMRDVEQDAIELAGRVAREFASDGGDVARSARRLVEHVFDRSWIPDDLALETRQLADAVAATDAV